LHRLACRVAKLVRSRAIAYRERRADAERDARRPGRGEA
jgi:hypothetical protein